LLKSFLLTYLLKTTTLHNTVLTISPNKWCRDSLSIKSSKHITLNIIQLLLVLYRPTGLVKLSAAIHNN